MIKATYSHSFQIRGVNQYGSAIHVFLEGEDIGTVWLYGDSTSFQNVIDKLNKKLFREKSKSEVEVGYQGDRW